MIETPTRKAEGSSAINPADRLSTALKLARATVIVCSDDKCHDEENVGNDERQVDDISQSVASTRDLTFEMEAADLEMQRALREAQDFLEDRQDTSTEDRQDTSAEDRQDIECTERDATQASDMEPPDQVDVQSLLDEIEALRKSVKEATDEVTELKSALNNPANKDGVDASPVEEVLCSKSTSDTTVITCSIRNYDEYKYGYGKSEMENHVHWEGDGKDDICGNNCFLGKIAKLLSHVVNKNQMLEE